MQENHKSVSNGLYEGFVIDNTLGRDVKFTIDQSGSGNNRINVVQISYPNGTDILDDRNPVNQTLSGGCNRHLSRQSCRPGSGPPGYHSSDP